MANNRAASEGDTLSETTLRLKRDWPLGISVAHLRAINQKVALNGGAWVFEASEGSSLCSEGLFMGLSVPKKWGLQTDCFRIICLR